MPQLQDPNFARTVVLLCDFVPEGAFGLVLNRPTMRRRAVMVRLDPPVENGNDLRSAHRRSRRARPRLDPERRRAGRRRAPDDRAGPVSLDVADPASTRAGDPSRAACAGARGICGVGTGTAGSGVVAISVADVRRRSGTRLRHRAAADVGEGHQAAWGRSVGVPDVARRPLTWVLRVPRGSAWFYMAQLVLQGFRGSGSENFLER